MAKLSKLGSRIDVIYQIIAFKSDNTNKCSLAKKGFDILQIYIVKI